GPANTPHFLKPARVTRVMDQQISEGTRVERDQSFGFAVCTPAGRPDAALAIAASRAGALGLLNLQCATDLSAPRTAVQRLATHARAPFGIVLDADAAEMLEALLEGAP